MAFTAVTSAFKAERAARRPRKPRTPILVSLVKLAARTLPRFAAVRRAAFHVGAFAAVDYGLWEIARPAGLIGIGVSLLLLDFLAGE